MHYLKYNLGDVVTSFVSGLTGTIISRHCYANGCIQYGIMSKMKSDDSKVYEDLIDENIVKLDSRSQLNLNHGPLTFPLGALVEDRITGFKGVSTLVSDYISGTHRITLQPTELDGGLPKKTSTFDSNQLTILQRDVYKPGVIDNSTQDESKKEANAPTGGPDREPPKLFI